MRTSSSTFPSCYFAIQHRVFKTCTFFVRAIVYVVGSKKATYSKAAAREKFDGALERVAARVVTQRCRVSLGDTTTFQIHSVTRRFSRGICGDTTEFQIRSITFFWIHYPFGAAGTDIVRA